MPSSRSNDINNNRAIEYKLELGLTDSADSDPFKHAKSWDLSSVEDMEKERKLEKEKKKIKKWRRKMRSMKEMKR